MSKKLKTISEKKHLEIVSEQDAKIIELETQLSQWKSDAGYYKRRMNELEEKLGLNQSETGNYQAVSEAKRDALLSAVSRSHFELSSVKAGEMNTSSLQRVLGVVQGNLAVALSQCDHMEVPTINLYEAEDKAKKKLDAVERALGGY